VNSLPSLAASSPVKEPALVAGFFMLNLKISDIFKNILQK
jgi:hypothetical protein